MKAFGLALGPGALLGAAHIGVLQVLESEGLFPSFVTGNSMGAIVGALYVGGMTPDWIAEKINDLNELKMYDVRLARSGVLGGKRIQELIRQLTDDKSADECHIPFGCLAVDIDKGELIELTKGKLHTIARASSSIPGMFTPVMMEDRRLVDGGVLVGVPGELCRKLGATTVIGVDVGTPEPASAVKSSMMITLRSFFLCQNSLHKLQPNGCDLVIRPVVHDRPMLRFVGAQETITRGREAAQRAMPEIKKLLAAQESEACAAE